MGPNARVKLVSNEIFCNGDAGVMMRMSSGGDLAGNIIRDHRVGEGGGCALLADVGIRPNVKLGAGNTYEGNTRGDVVWE